MNESNLSLSYNADTVWPRKDESADVVDVSEENTGMNSTHMGARGLVWTVIEMALTNEAI
jgi:hypothetical protein